MANVTGEKLNENLESNDEKSIKDLNLFRKKTIVFNRLLGFWSIFMNRLAKVAKNSTECSLQEACAEAKF